MRHNDDVEGVALECGANTLFVRRFIIGSKVKL
jgi:hypothetical protein